MMTKCSNKPLLAAKCSAVSPFWPGTVVSEDATRSVYNIYIYIYICLQCFCATVWDKGVGGGGVLRMRLGMHVGDVCLGMCVEDVC